MDCQLICWNWNVNAAGVICRLHPKDRSIFKFGKSLAEIVDEIRPSHETHLEINDTHHVI